MTVMKELIRLEVKGQNNIKFIHFAGDFEVRFYTSFPGKMFTKEYICPERKLS